MPHDAQNKKIAGFGWKNAGFATKKAQIHAMETHFLGSKNKKSGENFEN